MATKIIKMQDARKVIPRGLIRPLKMASSFFKGLGAKILGQAFLSFRLQGARGGHPPWRPFSQNTLKMPSGTFRIRYGTDIKPRGSKFRGQFWRGVRRYSAGSKLMQAGGGFRNSFEVLRQSGRNVIIGTRMKIAKQIMSSGGGRPVLFVTPSDRSLYTNMWRLFLDRNIRF